MNRKKALGKVLLTAVCCCAILSTPALAANLGGATVNASGLNLRAGSSTDSAVVSVAYQGASVVVREKTDGWYKVWYNGAEGYMSAEFLSFSETLDAALGTGTVQGSGVRLRESASFDGKVLGNYDAGVQMSVLGIRGAWYKVQYGSTVGYVHSDYMSLSAAAAAAVYDPEYSAAGQTIVDTAMKYLGVPYVWAGTSPKGFDCSGFVYYVYKECGYAINRTAASIYLNGDAVDKSELKVGDPICFTTNSSSGIGHVGIYIGDGQFIHASSSVGKVTITDLDENYYVRHYYGARRIAY